MRIALATEVHAPKIDGISNRLAHTVRELTALGAEAAVLYDLYCAHGNAAKDFSGIIRFVRGTEMEA